MDSSNGVGYHQRLVTSSQKLWSLAGSGQAISSGCNVVMLRASLELCLHTTTLQPMCTIHQVYTTILSDHTTMWTLPMYKGILITTTCQTSRKFFQGLPNKFSGKIPKCLAGGLMVRQTKCPTNLKIISRTSVGKSGLFTRQLRHTLATTLCRTCWINGQWGLMGINNVPLILMGVDGD